MKSVKPGRGPSMLGGIGSLFVGLFGVVWTLVAFRAGGGLFALFGVIFVAFAIVQAVYNFKNATGKNRYSAFDVVDAAAEPDPLQQRFAGDDRAGAVYGHDGYDHADLPPADEDGNSSAFCPYCGAPVAGDYEFCNKCGKRLP